MPQTLLDPELWPVLLQPAAWQVVSSLCPREVAPAAAPRHRAWMATHSHAHPYRELLLVLRGTGVMGHCGEAYPLAPGQVFVFEPGEAHDLEWAEWAPDADHLWFGFMGDSCFARVLAVRDGRLSRASDLGALLTPGQTGVRLPPVAEARRYPPAWWRLQLVVSLGSLISLLVRRGYDEESDDAAPFQERVIQTVREHIAQTAGRDADLGSLARLAGYSKFHFLRLFKAYTGCTVHQYVNQCRWARARELLGQRWRQADIATDLGFSGPAAFSRWRKQQEARGEQGAAAGEPE